MSLLHKQKRGDLMVEEIKRWVASNSLHAGDRLPKESELQALFSVSKGTTREALKSLEVQGLVTLKTGPEGGATLNEVSFDRTLQLVQNYLFFKEVDVAGIYALRRLLEPELVAGAIPHLTAAAIAKLEASVDSCALHPSTSRHALEQRHEELHFHDILIAANPNAVLRFVCRMLNEMLRRMVVFHSADALDKRYLAFGRANVRAHRAIIAAIRARNPARARAAMLRHIVDAEKQVKRLNGVLQSRLLLDSDMRMSVGMPQAKGKRRS